MIRLRAKNIPLMFAAGFIAAMFGITVWNLSVAAVVPRLAVRNWNMLFGAVQEKPVPITLAAILSGEAQTALSRRIGTALPIYAPAVRLKNQIEYTLFDVPGAPSIAFGREKRLYEWAYITEYCERGQTVDANALAAWADKVKDIQDYAVSHDKAFLYLITPSKVAIYPEYLPDTYLCASRAKGTTIKLPAFDRALDERGIHYLDGSRLMAAERSRQKIDLFPRGGTHWNALGAGLATQELVSLLRAQKPDLDLGGIGLAWSETHEPRGTDRDLLEMLNLYWPDADYPVPEISHEPSNETRPCRPAQIMEVGGSFLEQVNAALLESRCPPKISYWFYWDHLHMSFAGQGRMFAPPQDAARRADLAGSDVILLEENEQNISETPHLNQLHALIVSARANTTAAGTDAH
ncbi:MAG: hypothetical protein NVSMB26_28190 [Beijerinckiaceae bacterium]